MTRNIVYANENSNATKQNADLIKGSNYRVYLAKTLQSDYGLAYQEDQAGKQALEEKFRREASENDRKKEAERAQYENERQRFDRAKIYLSSLPPEGLETIRQEALASLSDDQKALLSSKSCVSNFILKHAMNKIALERIKAS